MCTLSYFVVMYVLTRICADYNSDVKDIFTMDKKRGKLLVAKLSS